MGVCVADCGADEWLLCVATPELKERLVRRTGRKKVIESGKHSQRGIPEHCPPAPPAPRRPLIGPPITLLLPDWTPAAHRYCPSVHRGYVSNREEVRFYIGVA